MFDTSSKDARQQALDILGLSTTATLEQATEAFRKLASDYHPDRVAHLAVEFHDLAKQRMAEINQAYAFLKPILAAEKKTSQTRAEPRSGPSQQQTQRGRWRKDRSTSSESTSNHSSVQFARLIEFSCPHCMRRIRVSATLRGRNGSCTSCKQPIAVPTHVELCCDYCGQLNRVPNVVERKRVLCRKCYGTLATANCVTRGN